MKKNIPIILTVIISVLAIVFIVYAANTFPTTLNDWEDGDIIESSWADSIEDAIGVTNSLVQTSLDWKVRRGRSFDIRVSGGSFARVSSLSFDAGMFNISNSASRSAITLDWTNGPASRSAAETISGAWTFSASNTGLTVNNNASVSAIFEVTGDLKFDGDLMPDGSDCSANQILKKTGADDWDCATDSGGVSSDSLNFDEFQNPLVLDLAITVTSGAFPWDWNGTKLIDINSASVSERFAVGQTGSRGVIDLGNAGVRLSHDGDGAVTFLGLGNGTDEDFTINLDDVSNEATFTTTTGITRFLWSGINVSTSLSFEAVKTASASLFDGSAFTGVGDCNDDGEAIGWSVGLFICNTLADADIPDAITVSGGTIGANNISSGVTWTTLGTLTIGDNGDAVNFDTSTWDVSAGVFSGVAGMTGTGVYDFGGATSFEIPNSAGGGTIDTAGEIGVDTATESFNFFSGTREVVLGPFDKCFAYSLDGTDLSANSIFAIWTADEPYTLALVTMKASGSNSATWNLVYGLTVPTTTVFSAQKQASGSALVRYTSFTNSAIPDGNTVYGRVTSKSATLDDVLIRGCMYKTP